MQEKTILKRALSVQLLLVVTLVPFGRQILDLQAEASRTGAVEAEHSHACVAPHNHALCILWQKTPWTPPAAQPAPVVVDATATALERPQRASRSSGAIVLRFARSPPIAI